MVDDGWSSVSLGEVVEEEEEVGERGRFGVVVDDMACFGVGEVKFK